MKSYLVFRLYGAMASWGVAAAGGDRQTAVYPSRSAILGLLGAAMGIKRDEEEKLKALQHSVSVAAKQITPSSLIRDFHTIQVPPDKKGVIHRTRKSELSQKDLGTILSHRDYRCDGLWVVAVSLTAQATVSLEALEKALLSPVYALYLGRKSCPPALPLMPKIIKESDLKTALDTHFPILTKTERSDALWFRDNGWVTYFWEGDKHDLGLQNVLTFHPWDEPENRARWQFRQRVMHQASVQIQEK